jgi:S1-C subfamily serine protease
MSELENSEESTSIISKLSEEKTSRKKEKRRSSRLLKFFVAASLVISIFAFLSSDNYSEDLFYPPSDIGGFIKEISESIVLVECNGWGTGFAFYIGQESTDPGFPTHIVTNFHVIDECVNDVQSLIVSIGPNHETKVRSKIMSTDEENDFAILLIDAEIPVLESAQEFAVPGWWTMAIGNPVDTYFDPAVVLRNSTTFGHISYVHDTYWNYTSATINGGNSGGPLVNSIGEVIGINTLAAASTEDGVWNLAIDTAILCLKLIDNCEDTP